MAEGPRDEYLGDFSRDVQTASQRTDADVPAADKASKIRAVLTRELGVVATQLSVGLRRGAVAVRENPGILFRGVVGGIGVLVLLWAVFALAVFSLQDYLPGEGSMSAGWLAVSGGVLLVAGYGVPVVREWVFSDPPQRFSLRWVGWQTYLRVLGWLVLAVFGAQLAIKRG